MNLKVMKIAMRKLWSSKILSLYPHRIALMDKKKTTKFTNPEYQGSVLKYKD
jgi:hypothetical protein